LINKKFFYKNEIYGKRSTTCCAFRKPLKKVIFLPLETAEKVAYFNPANWRMLKNPANCGIAAERQALLCYRLSHKLRNCSAKKNDRQRKTLQLQIDFVVSAPCAATKSFFQRSLICGIPCNGKEYL
jgi:hypothetical protein